MPIVRWLVTPILATTLGALVVLSSGSASAAPGITTLASVDSAGVEADDDSDSPAISDDGAIVAFISDATNLATITFPENNVFVHNRATGVTDLVNVDSQGNAANERTYEIDISGDGRYVAFDSLANNLVSGDTNDGWDIFVHDRVTGETIRASLNSAGEQATTERPQTNPSISADGRYVAWATSNEGFVLPDNVQGGYEILVRDLLTGTTTRASVDNQGNEGTGNSLSPDISADGRFVAFDSKVTTLVPGDNGALWDVFVRDLQAGTTTRVSDGNLGGTGNGNSGSPAISADGRYVAFTSTSSNLVADDTNGESDVFVYDSQTGVTELVSVSGDGFQGSGASNNPSISADGRHVIFSSQASDLVPNDTNAVEDIFAHDRLTGQTVRISVDSQGNESDDRSRLSAVSSGGGAVVFESLATNLVANDTNAAWDVFVHERDSLCDLGSEPDDTDCDGVDDSVDNCVGTGNPGQTDTDADGEGDACDDDDDNDGVPDSSDNCRVTSNAGQSDGDADGTGDACDSEGPSPNTSGAGGGDDCIDGVDNDGDGLTDTADPACDSDGDGVPDVNDNCPTTANPGQEDTDSDDVGDACDPCNLGPGYCVDQVAIDVQDGATPANTPTSIGSIEVCARVNDNDLLDLDEDTVDTIVIDVVTGPDGIPVEAPLFAFDFGLLYNESVVHATSADIHQLLASSPGSNLNSGVEPAPDSDGTFQVGALELGYSYEAGPGVLARIELEAVGSGYSTLSLNNLALLDPSAELFQVASIGAATIVSEPVAEGAPCTDSDGDGFVDGADNCPDVPDLNQSDFDGDSLGDICDADDDNDGAADSIEGPCGGDPFDANVMPERVDGAYAGTDDDGDTLIDEALPAGAEAYDCDGDGYTGAAEAPILGAMAMDQDPCGTGGWPSDIVSGGIPDSTNKVTIGDLSSFVAPVRHVSTNVGTYPGDERWDLSPGPGPLSTDINVLDLSALVSGPTGYPPMLGGARALGGPACPWAP